MAYDASKDEKLASYDGTAVDNPGEQNRVVAEVYAYNGGDPKVQIQRYLGEKPVKAGRLTIDEVRNLIPMLQELIKDYTPDEEEVNAEG